MKSLSRTLVALLIYLVLSVMLYISITKNYEHEEMSLYGSLICYSCIGV